MFRSTVISARSKESNSYYYPLSREAIEAIDAIEYITQHLKKDEEYKMVRTGDIKEIIVVI